MKYCQLFIKKNAVGAMLQEKAVTRVAREHTLVDAALTTLLTIAFQFPVPKYQDEIHQKNL